jgi:hypothetical protein
MSDDTEILILGSRKRGRPRVEEPQRTVCIRIPADRYDRLASLAVKRDESMSSVVRQILLAQKVLGR